MLMTPVKRASQKSLMARKVELADNKIQAGIMSAESFPEKVDILEFIVKLKQQFNIFCMENEI